MVSLYDTSYKRNRGSLWEETMANDKTFVQSQLDPLPNDLPFRVISKTIGRGAYASYVFSQFGSSLRLNNVTQDKKGYSSNRINASFCCQIYSQGLRSQAWPNISQADRHGGVSPLAYRTTPQYHRMVCYRRGCCLEMDCYGVR